MIDMDREDIDRAREHYKQELRLLIDYYGEEKHPEKIERVLTVLELLEKEAPKEPTEGDDTPAWAKALIEQNQQLKSRLDSIEGEKVQTSRKQQIDALVEKLPEALRKPYTRMAYKDLSDEDFGALLSEVGADVEAMAKEASSSGALFGKPKASQGGAEKAASDAEVDAVVDGMKI